MATLPHSSAYTSGKTPILADSDYLKGLFSGVLGAPMDIINTLVDLNKVDRGDTSESLPYKERFGTADYLQTLLGGNPESGNSLAGYLSTMPLNPTAAIKAGIPFLANVIRTADKGEGLASLLNKESLFHGSRINKLKSLQRPTGEGTEHLSQGGVYLTRGKGDPRLIQFGGVPAGSVYEAKPSFTRTLDPRQLPADERKILSKGIPRYDPDIPHDIADELLSDLDRKRVQSLRLNRDTPRIRTLLKDKYDLREQHYPARVSTRFSDEIQKLGYDSVMYPKMITPITRGGKKAPNYRETIIALDPDNTLDIIDETNVGDFLRIMLQNADRSTR
tara:strand:+ start:43 stop:1041 length:999 start_codon:yes stop_codon:yes gene_type:complete